MVCLVILTQAKPSQVWAFFSSVQNKMYSQCCTLAYKHRYCTKFRPLPWASDAYYRVCVLMAHTFILNADGMQDISLGDAVLRAATNAVTDVRP